MKEGSPSRHESTMGGGDLLERVGGERPPTMLALGSGGGASGRRDGPCKGRAGQQPAEDGRASGGESGGPAVPPRTGGHVHTVTFLPPPVQHVVPGA